MQLKLPFISRARHNAEMTKCRRELVARISEAFIETTPTHTAEVEAFHDELLNIEREVLK